MKALALVDAPNHVCSRYRLRAFEPALQQAEWSLVPQALARGAYRRWRQLAQAAEYDAVVLQRRLLPGWQLHQLRRRSRRLIFDFDDAVLYRDSYDARGPHCRKRARRFARTMQLVDLVIAGNDFLADCALRAGAAPERVRVIPTCVETRLYTPKPPPTAPAAGARPGLDLVWIGSSSTLQGLEQQRALWERIGREVPGVRLRVICDRFPSFESIPIVAVPWRAETERAELAAGDVGVSWIPDDLWSRGKCGLKTLQYQAAGLPVVTNPVGVHAEMVAPGVNGFLATSQDEWVEAVRRLASDVALRARMGVEARRGVDANYSVAAWSETFAASIAGVEPAGAFPRGGRPHCGSLRRDDRPSAPAVGRSGVP